MTKKKIPGGYMKVGPVSKPLTQQGGYLLIEIPDKKLSDKIIKFLNEHPLISHIGLERECGLPQSTIYKALSAGRGIPEKYIPAIFSVLKKYGMKK